VYGPFYKDDKEPLVIPVGTPVMVAGKKIGEVTKFNEDGTYTITWMKLVTS
jgi:hypothetical protein